MEGSKKNEIVIKKANDHWAFLEYIEAPMWVDLTLEPSSGGDHEDDEWFNESHLFHQWSDSQLKSMFSHPGEEILTSEVVDSPKIPSSVSRSRGKHYKSQNWGGINLNGLLDKPQGPSKRCIQAGSSFGQQVKSKSISRQLTSRLGLTLQPNGREKTKPMASFSKTGESNTRTSRSTIASVNAQQPRKHKEVSNQPCDKKIRSSSVRNKVSRISRVQLRQNSNKPHDQRSGSGSSSFTSTRSTITLEKTQQQKKEEEVSSQPCDHKIRSSSVQSVRETCVTNKASRVSIVQFQQNYMDVSCKPCDQKSGSSSDTSASLLKSSSTKQASRAEIGGDSMQSRGRKSSTGNSSVGSCSNPGNELKCVSKHQRGKITDRKDVATLTLADKIKCNPPNISQTSTILVEGAKPGNRKGCNVNFAKPAYHRTAKSLVQYQSIHSRAVLSGKVNIANSCTGAKEKLGTRKFISSTAKGKENATKNVKVNRGVSNLGILKNHKSTELNRHEKGETAGSAALTILAEDKNQHEARKIASLVRRIYLR